MSLTFRNIEELTRFSLTAADQMAINGFRGSVAEQLNTYLQQINEDIDDATFERIVAIINQRRTAWGPLSGLIDDPAVTDIAVNGPNSVWALGAEGWRQHSEVSYGSVDQLRQSIDRLVTASTASEALSQVNPVVDGRMPDNGPRICAVIPPATIGSPTLTVRKYRHMRMALKDMVNPPQPMISRDMAVFLDACVRARLNIIVSGGTGTGKTTMLGALLGRVAAEDRLVLIEDTPELAPPAAEDGGLRNTVPLHADRDDENRTPAELLRASLRMSPDRIIVGECRGGEALMMLSAMNTGHDGSMSSVHANNPTDALARLEALAAMAGSDLPIEVIRYQVGSAIHLLLQIQRDPVTQHRYVSEIAEVERGSEGRLRTRPLFRFMRSAGVSIDELEPGDAIPGRFSPLNRPSFWESQLADIWPHGLPDPFDGLEEPGD